MCLNQANICTQNSLNGLQDRILAKRLRIIQANGMTGKAAGEFIGEIVERNRLFTTGHFRFK